MVVDGVRASPEFLGDDADGVSEDKQLEHAVLTIGEPCAWVVDVCQRGLSTQSQWHMQCAKQ